jgi:hypothetical protein
VDPGVVVDVVDVELPVVDVVEPAVVDVVELVVVVVVVGDGAGPPGARSPWKLPFTWLA